MYGVRSAQEARPLARLISPSLHRRVTTLARPMRTLGRSQRGPGTGAADRRGGELPERPRQRFSNSLLYRFGNCPDHCFETNQENVIWNAKPAYTDSASFRDARKSGQAKRAGIVDGATPLGRDEQNATVHPESRSDFLSHKLSGLLICGKWTKTGSYGFRPIRYIFGTPPKIQLLSGTRILFLLPLVGISAPDTSG